jgi:hypothetical protein
MATSDLSPEYQNKVIQDSVKKSLESLFPIKSGERELRLKNVNIEDVLSNTDFPAQRETKLNRKS